MRKCVLLQVVISRRMCVRVCAYVCMCAWVCASACNRLCILVVVSCHNGTRLIFHIQITYAICHAWMRMDNIPSLYSFNNKIRAKWLVALYKIKTIWRLFFTSSRSMASQTSWSNIWGSCATDVFRSGVTVVIHISILL